METWLQITISALFGQVLLVAVVYVRLLALRWRAVRRRDVRMKDIALSNDAYDIRTRQVSNNLANQFELPVMFYVCVLLAAVTDAGSMALAAFAVLFVAARWVHAWVHMGSNFVPTRFFAFGAGALALAGCWISLGLALLA